MHRLRPPAWLVVCAITVAAPGTARAAACCLSSSAFGIGRLALWEELAVILGASYAPTLGRWDEEGKWLDNPSRYEEREWRPQVSLLVALHDRLQVSARLPWVVTQKSSDAQHESSGRLGDALVALRFEPVAQGEYEFLPEVALTAGVTMPTGRSANETKKLLLTDVTGRGAWVLSAAISAELAQETWFALAGVGMTLPLPAEVGSGHEERIGAGLQLTLASGAQVYDGLVVSVVGHYASEATTLFDGKLVPMSAAYELGLGPAVAWLIDPNWTLQGALDFGLPTAGLGMNRQGRVTTTVGIRYAYF